MVRLKALAQIGEQPVYNYFNSNMVRLKGCSCSAIDVLACYFNSNMVRLKVVYNQQSNRSRTAFQFQYGSIKRTDAQL